MAPIDLASFLGLVQRGFNVVPLSETLQLDRETPVSLYQRFGARAIFLLESAALGEETGRYSFIGLDRLWRVTTAGGDLIAVEVALLPGKGAVTLTGQLGEVMRESAQAALSYARDRAKDLGLDEKFHESLDVHIHIPAGAVDGPGHWRCNSLEW